MRKNTNEISSLDSLKYIPGISIFKEPVCINASSADLLLMPWRKSEDDERVVVNGSNAEYLFCHTTIRGAKFDKYRHSGAGISSNQCKHFKKVYTGHIHTSQDYKNICYVGNPYQMTRSDTNNMKGFRCLDLKSGEEQFFENTYSPKFVKIYVNKTLEVPLRDILKVCNNNFVDVYVPNDYLMKYQVTPLIDEISKVSKRLDVIPFEMDEDNNLNAFDIDYDKTLDTYNLCEKFVDGMSIDKGTKTKILKTLKKAYIEAIK